ncbi:MAG TPA: SIS domain-containing protein [Clostridiales bacterium]|nr:SIS domain-containing protein [Clostridiales bacterium]
MQKFYDNYNGSLIEALHAIDPQQLSGLTDAIDRAYQNGNQIFILGNGGSAACASHWVCDFNKGVNTPNSKRMKMYSLSDNTSIVSALGNDISYNDIFSYQLKNFAAQEDLIICLSVSGKSPNLISAVEYGNKIGCNTYSIIGDYEGELGRISKHAIIVKSKNYGVVEDIHLIINHMISQYMKEKNEQQAG